MEAFTGEADISHLAGQVERLDMVRSRIADLKKEEQRLIAEIRAGVGQHQFGLVASEQAIRLDARNNSHIDRDSLLALIGPEALGTVTRQTPYVVVRVIGRFRAGGK